MSEQPMPTPNDGESVQAMVRADLVAREAAGVKRYGTSLQAHNGRDALRDAYEEALDLACYLRQAIAERRDVRSDDDSVHRARYGRSVLDCGIAADASTLYTYDNAYVTCTACVRVQSGRIAQRNNPAESDDASQ